MLYLSLFFSRFNVKWMEGNFKVYLIYLGFPRQIKDAIQMKDFSCVVVLYLQMIVLVHVIIELYCVCNESTIQISYICNN